MYGPLALLVVATALFAAGLVRWRTHHQPGPQAPSAIDLEQVQAFVFVGSGALVVLGVAVLVLGLAGRGGPAEATGVLGLIAYLVYLVLAVLLIRRTARRRPRRAAPGPAHDQGDALRAGPTASGERLGDGYRRR